MKENENLSTQKKTRYFDKIIDELANGKKTEKFLRQ